MTDQVTERIHITDGEAYANRTLCGINFAINFSVSSVPARRLYEYTDRPSDFHACPNCIAALRERA